MDLNTTPTTRAARYTWRDWREAHREQGLLYVSLGYWHELKRWPVPGRIFRWAGWLPDLWYYVKCRCWRRYHVLTIRTMPPTWQDSDERMLHAMFAILESVILKERIFERNGYAETDDAADGKSWKWALTETQALWQWWTVARPKREAEYERRLAVWHDCYMRDRHAFTAAHPDWQRTDNPHVSRYSLPEEHVEPDDTQEAEKHMRELDDDVRDAEDTEMLIRLVRLRGYLWT